MSIADAMIYIIGIDPEFKYNEEYKKFLSALEKKVKFEVRSYAVFSFIPFTRTSFFIGTFNPSFGIS